MSTWLVVQSLPLRRRRVWAECPTVEDAQAARAQLLDQRPDLTGRLRLMEQEAPTPTTEAVRESPPKEAPVAPPAPRRSQETPQSAPAPASPAPPPAPSGRTFTMPSREQLAATPMTMPERADPGALRPVRTVRGGNGFVF